MPAISRTFSNTKSSNTKSSNTKSLTVVLAIASAALTGLIMLGEGAVQARGAGETVNEEAKSDKLVVPGDPGRPALDERCLAKPVRVIYGGYGEYACTQKSAL